MNLRDYYYSLSAEGREAYADRAGTTTKYCERHLMLPNPTRVPRRDLMVALSEASKGKVSQSSVFAHFFGKAA